MKKLYKLFLQRQHYLKRHLEEEGVKHRLMEIDLAIVAIQQKMLKTYPQKVKVIDEAVKELYPDGTPKDIHFSRAKELALLCIEKTLKKLE